MESATSKGTPRVGLYHAYPHRMGGSQQVTLLLARSLPAFGYTPVIICPDEGRLTSAAREQNTEVLICTPAERWRVHGRSASGLRAWLSARHAEELVRYWFQMRRALRDYHIDVLHCNDIRAVVMAAPAGRLLRVPTLWHVHRAPPSRRTAWLSLLPASVVSRTVLVSRAMLEYWPLPRVLLAAWRVIANGIEPIPAAALQPRRQGPPQILVVGALSPAKGQDLVLKAMPQVAAAVPEAQCLLVGKDFGDGRYEVILRTLVRKQNLQSRVEFAGQRDDVAALLAASDCVVVPSRSETFGMLALEAMMQGKPVIAAATGGLRELILPHETGLLVPPGNPDSLAQAIIRVLQNRSLAQRLGAAGRARALRAFTAQRMAHSFGMLYDEMLGRRKSSPHGDLTTQSSAV